MYNNNINLFFLAFQELHSRAVKVDLEELLYQKPVNAEAEHMADVDSNLNLQELSVFPY